MYRREPATLTACRKSLGHRGADRAADDAAADDLKSRANPSVVQRSPSVLQRDPSVLRYRAIRVVRRRATLARTGGQRGAAPGLGLYAPRMRSAQGRRA